MEQEPTVTVELEWTRPSQTYGELKGYRLRYGVKDQLLKEVFIKGKLTFFIEINIVFKLKKRSQLMRFLIRLFLLILSIFAGQSTYGNIKIRKPM